jgi:hypothetical protein
VDRTCLPTAETEIDTMQQQDAENLAVSVLWALSGRQYGLCPVIVRPCPQPCGEPYQTISPWMVVWDGANWRNLACGCGARCSWRAPNVVHLASRIGLPINSIVEVTIAGVVLDDSEYRLEGDLLYRVNGNWPSQDLSRPLDEPGTWSVTYLRGTAPPPGTAKLVGLLAAEFLAACNGGKCRLPRRVKTVTRQGVSYDMVDPTDIYETGKTGISEVDLWLSSVNPHHIMGAPEVR